MHEQQQQQRRQHQHVWSHVERHNTLFIVCTNVLVVFAFTPANVYTCFRMKNKNASIELFMNCVAGKHPTHIHNYMFNKKNSVRCTVRKLYTVYWSIIYKLNSFVLNDNCKRFIHCLRCILMFVAIYHGVWINFKESISLI